MIRPGQSARRQTAKIAALAAAAVLCGAAPVRAQTSTPADPDLSTEQMRRAGPFHVRPFALLKDVGYDDNIRFDARTRQGDGTATTGGGLEALLLAGDRGGLRLSQELDYVAFQRNTDLDHWNGHTRARGILLLRGLLLSLEDQFDSVRERPIAEIDERLRRKNDAVTAGLRTLGRGRLGLETYVRGEHIDYASDNPVIEDSVRLLNRDEATLSVLGRVRVLPKTTFILEGVVSSITFEDRAQGRDTGKRAILTGFRLDPSASVQGDFKVGPMVFEARDRPGTDYHGLAGEGHLGTRLGRAARLKGTFDRNVAFSTLQSNFYFVSTSWSAAYEQFFSRRMSGELAYGRTLNHYPIEVAPSGPDPFQGVRDDRVTDYRATLRYRTNTQMTIEASAYHLNRDSTDDFYDRVRNFYTFGTTYSF